MANFIDLKNIKIKKIDEFSKIEYKEEKYDFLYSGNWFKVEGLLNQEDINNINQFNSETYLVFENTKNIDVDILKQITNPNIKFSVIGGNDYLNKNKFMNTDYLSRTIIEKEHLIKIIEYFKRIESHIDISWNETQKCMFLYGCLVKDFEYQEKYDSIFDYKKIEPQRSLNGILYKKLVCAGFSQVFKEGMDRLGIENYYQNKRGVHDWNVVRLDGKLMGMDITWDCCNKGQYNHCSYNNFGGDSKFYENENHRTNIIKKEEVDGRLTEIEEYDSEETKFDLAGLTPNEIRLNYEVIKSSLLSRKREPDILLEIENYKKYASQEIPYFILFEYLKTQNVFSEEELKKFNNFCNRRKSIVMDICRNNYKILANGEEIGLPEMKNIEFTSDGQLRTPFGINYPRINSYQVPKEKLTEINKMLKHRMNNYYENMLKDYLKDFETNINNYIKLSKIDKTEGESVILANIYSKLNILLNSKKTLLEMGIDSKLIENMETLINKAFNVDSLSKEEQKKNQMKKDIDYLYVVFSDYEGLKSLAEQHYGRKFTDNEWLQSFQSSLFMRETFKEGLSEFNITDDALQEIINNVIESRGLKNQTK